jgi:hypothetical protein
MDTQDETFRLLRRSDFTVVDAEYRAFMKEYNASEESRDIRAELKEIFDRHGWTENEHFSEAQTRRIAERTRQIGELIGRVATIDSYKVSHHISVDIHGYERD